jgi:hypothetical protein
MTSPSPTALANARESQAFWTPFVRLPDVHVWALIGNEAGEASFLAHPVGDHGEAFGCFQWHLPRILDMVKGCGIDVRTASHGQQIAAAHWEMTKGSYRKVWPALMATTTVEEAVTVLVRDFERSANQARDIPRRVALAQTWRDLLTSGKPRTSP